MRRTLPILGFLFTASQMHAEELPLVPYHQSQHSVPSQAKATLRLPASVMIGEEIEAALVIENTGATPFDVKLGGDYRSTGYPQRIKVRVRDAAMQLLPELPEEPIGGGGFMRPKTIQPGGSDAIDFPLDCYVSFPKSGVYIVTAGHDLGWKVDKDHPHPLGSATLVVSEPTKEQAAAQVEKIRYMQPTTPPRDESDRLSRESRLEKQLCVLRHPIYLPPLCDYAKSGSKAAVMGLGHIVGPDATEALLSLLDHASPEIIATSARQILQRLPSRDDLSKPVVPYVWGNLYQIDPLLPASWEAKFDHPLVDSAVKMLSHSDSRVVEMAGALIQQRVELSTPPSFSQPSRNHWTFIRILAAARMQTPWTRPNPNGF